MGHYVRAYPDLAGFSPVQELVPGTCVLERAVRAPVLLNRNDGAVLRPAFSMAMMYKTKLPLCRKSRILHTYQLACCSRDTSRLLSA